MASNGEASKPDQSSAEEKTVNSSELRAQTLGGEESQKQKAQYRRTLILFFDGTANEYSSKNTNVVRFFSCLQKSHPKQLVYYQTGVGTSSTTKFLIPGMALISKAVDQGVALNLEEHLAGGYRFLQSNWKSGDKICIFGFSRGAYTARALAGMLHAVGLLPPDMPEQVEFAYRVYKNLGTGKTRHDSGRNYKRDFCRNVTVDFLGVWDTVASVGFVVPRTLPFSQSNGTTKIFRHALALDERRVKFIPSFWRLSGVKENLDENPEWNIKKGAEVVIEPHASTTTNAIHWLRGVTKIIITWWFDLFIRWWAHPILDLLGFCKEDHSEPTKIALIPSEKNPPDVKEVWFAGDHCDVGGGNEEDDRKDIYPDENNIKYTPALANIPLRWMIREFYEAGLLNEFNIRWRAGRLARYGIYLPPVKYTNDDPNDVGARDNGKSCAGPPSKKDLDEAPETIELHTTAKEKHLHPRRAKFTRSKVFSSKVMIDLDFHDRDVAAPHNDSLWNWKKFSFGRFMGMMLWWFLEIVPFVSNVQNKKTLLWESKVGFNLFKPRDIPREGEAVQLDTAKGEWKKFFDMRSKPHLHWSVLERIEKHGYRPRSWHPDEKSDEWTLVH